LVVVELELVQVAPQLRTTVLLALVVLVVAQGGVLHQVETVQELRAKAMLVVMAAPLDQVVEVVEQAP
jgi:hypothetical protein